MIKDGQCDFLLLSFAFSCKPKDLIGTSFIQKLVVVFVSLSSKEILEHYDLALELESFLVLDLAVILADLPQ